MPKEGIEISLDDPDDQNNKPANQNPAIPEDSDVGSGAIFQLNPWIKITRISS